MLPSLNLPASLLDLLYELRPCFTAPGFATFCGLVAGLAGQVRRRTVVGMLLGACLQHAWPHDRAHYFFARARWELDQLGLAVAQLAVLLMLPPGADLQVAVDDSVFRRAGRKVHGAGWQHDGSAPGKNKLVHNDELVSGEIGQVGTQLDGLGHIGVRMGKEDVFYNGNKLSEFGDTYGLKKLGVEKLKPLFTRGHLVDMVAVKGRMMEAGEEIMVADIRAALQRHGPAARLLGVVSGL